MRRLKLGQLLDTLPERLALARSHELSHIEFFEQLFSDEVQRRDAASAGLRARAANLDPPHGARGLGRGAKVTYDRAVWSELVSMRFVDQARNAFILGPVGVGKTFMATALGHIACRRRISVHFERADRLHKRLKAARLDASYDQEMRKLIGVDLLVIDDFALQPLDCYRDGRHLRALRGATPPKATVLTSNRDPSEWLATMADPLLAQSAVDRLKSAAWELVIEGESYRQHEKPTLGPDPSRTPRQTRSGDDVLDTDGRLRDHRSAGRSGRDVVPCFWQRGGPLRLARRASSDTNVGLGAVVVLSCPYAARCARYFRTHLTPRRSHSSSVGGSTRGELTPPRPVQVQQSRSRPAHVGACGLRGFGASR